MPVRRTALAVTAAGILALSAPAVLTLTSVPASAVTGSCQSTARPVSGPVGCGSFFLPGVSYPHAGTVLTLTAAGQVFGSRVEAEPMKGTPLQDWTAYQVCTGLTRPRSAASPCGAGKLVPGELVLRLSPGGTQPGGGVNSFQSLCLVDNNARAALGFCQSGSAFYDEGYPEAPVTNGASPVVNQPNPAETWKLVKSGKGVELVNAHSGRALSDPGSGGPSTKLTTSSPAGGANQVWQLMGNTDPYPQEPGWYGGLSAS